MKADNPVKTSENKPERDEKGQLLPGNTANPNGRPKGSLSLVSMMKDRLEEEYPGDDDLEEKRTYAKKLIETIVDEAIDNKDQAQIRNILQYIEGMPKQSIDMDMEVSGLETLFKKARE